MKQKTSARNFHPQRLDFILFIGEYQFFVRKKEFDARRGTADTDKIFNIL